MLDDHALDILFRRARTQNGFLDKPVSDDQLRALYALMQWGPTTMNSQPARLVFVRTKAGKEKLAPALSPGNLDKTMKAPVTAIVAYDLRFYENLPRTFPNNPKAQSAFEGEEKRTHVQTTALRNGSLQGAYLILAARALGLDCGPMSGFDNAKVDAAFFPDGRVRSNFLCNLGYGDPSKVFPRNPRLAFDEVCTLA
ncbi:MAG: malonic semialdehyde reductase [Burkholderiales bacterium]|nr:malonic semialdehyde reductase [Burkholderiales bacterium]